MADSDSNTNAALVNTLPDQAALVALKDALLAVPLPHPPNTVTPDRQLENDFEAAWAALVAETIPAWGRHQRKMKARLRAGERMLFSEAAPHFIEVGWYGATREQISALNTKYVSMKDETDAKQDGIWQRRLDQHREACIQEVIETDLLPRNKTTLVHIFISLDDTVPAYVRDAVYRVLARVLEEEAQAFIDQYHLPLPPFYCVQCFKRREPDEKTCSTECWEKYKALRREAIDGMANSELEWDNWTPYVTDGRMCRYCSQFYQLTMSIEDHGLCGFVCMAHFVSDGVGWQFDHEIIDTAQYLGLTWSQAIELPATTPAQARAAYNRAVAERNREIEPAEKESSRRGLKNITPAASMADRILNAARAAMPGVLSDAALKRAARVRPTEAVAYVRERDRLVDIEQLGRRGRGTRGSGFEFWAQ